MYFHMKQRLRAWTGLPPCLGVSRSRYHQAAYRTLTNQNLVNRRPTKTTVQIWAGEGSRSCQAREEGGETVPTGSARVPGTRPAVPSSPRPAARRGGDTASPPRQASLGARIRNQAGPASKLVPPTVLAPLLAPALPLSLRLCGKAVCLHQGSVHAGWVTYWHLCPGPSFGELRPSEELPPRPTVLSAPP